jgi:hypothetical protein
MVTVDVARLTLAEVTRALDSGQRVAQGMMAEELIIAAVLMVQGAVVTVGDIGAATGRTTPRSSHDRGGKTS